jgi:integrase
MPSILKVKGRWRAQIRRSGQSIAKTFDSKADAAAWAREVESGIDRGAAPARAAPADAATLTISAAVKRYREMRLGSGRAIAPESNEHYMLQHLEDDLGAEIVAAVRPRRLVEWAQMRKAQGAGGYTINMELSKLGTVLRHVGSLDELLLPDIVGAARPTLHHLQLISGGNRRTRRIEGDEFERLLEYFADRPRIADALQVAAITGLRRSELLGMKWADLDPKRKAVLIRMRKHPRQIQARDEWVPLLGESWAIVQRQSREDERIFTMHEQTITKGFTKACRELGIPDLHLHDLRREAASRLREIGFDTDERKRITGHASDRMHERYVAVRLEDLHKKYRAARKKPAAKRAQKRAA